MKLTKRMKNSIIQGVIANMLFLLILIGTLMFFLYPRVGDVETKKTNLIDTYNQLQSNTLKGISFTDFKSAINNSELSKDSYTLNLMRNITEEFYNENFTNTGTLQYNEFLDVKKSSIAVKQSSDDYIEKDKTLSTILPIYDEKNIFSDEGLSDFFFTNYIENILYSFNLSSKGEIGIGGLEKVGEEDENTSEEIESDSLQESVYSIPLSFDIEGQKTDVVDFIHYFENVGGIILAGEGLEIYEDKFLSRRLEGTEKISQYNIYKNQIADIKSISLEKYPDSSSLKTQSLVLAMKGDQAKEKVSVVMELAFYVAGIPGYKMEKYIQDFLLHYQEMQAKISQDSVKYTSQAYKFNQGEQLIAIKNLQSLNTVILSLSEDIVKIQGGLIQKDDIQETYEQVVVYEQQISRLEASYEKQLNILNK